MTFTVVFDRPDPDPDVEIEVYGGLAAADSYLFGSNTRGAAKFRLLAQVPRQRLLVDATRYIDSIAWVGAANQADGTTLAWPRTGVNDEGGEALGNAEQLALVEKATFELAAILSANPNVAGSADQSTNIKSLGAGTAKLEFFGPTSVNAGTATQLPTVIDRLLGRWLKGAGASGDALVLTGSESGVSCPTSQFGDCEWNRGG